MRTAVAVGFVIAVIVTPWSIATTWVMGTVGLLALLAATATASAAAKHRAAQHSANVVQLEREYRAEFGSLQPPSKFGLPVGIGKAIDVAAGIAQATGAIGFVAAMAAKVAANILDDVAEGSADSAGRQRRAAMWLRINQERGRAAEVIEESRRGSVALWAICSTAFLIRVWVVASNQRPGAVDRAPSPTTQASVPSGPSERAVEATPREAPRSAAPEPRCTVLVRWNRDGYVGLFSRPWDVEATYDEREAARIRNMDCGTRLGVFEVESDRWLRVRTPEGAVGYVGKKQTEGGDCRW